MAFLPLSAVMQRCKQHYTVLFHLWSRARAIFSVQLLHVLEQTLRLVEKEAIWIALVGLLVDVTFNFWARILKFWILKVLKRCPNHSFLWFFYLLSEKSSYLVNRVLSMFFWSVGILQIFMYPGSQKLEKTEASDFCKFSCTRGHEN